MPSPRSPLGGSRCGAPRFDGAAFRELHADDGFAQRHAELVRAFPDLQVRAEDLVIDEAAAKVAVRWSATGTNRERFLGIGPTHRRTALSGIEIIEVRDGRIVRRWGTSSSRATSIASA